MVGCRKNDEEVCHPHWRVACCLMSAPEAKLPSSGGLHTREDLTLVGRVHLWLRRASRNFYRQIRHPRSRRRGGWRKWFADRIHNRALWRPERNAVAAGVGGGLFLAMVPVPLQSLLAAGVGMARGWNLPATIAATWVSNPFTYPLMLLGARYTVMGFFELAGLECAVGSMTLGRLREVADAAVHLHVRTAWSLGGPALLELLLGMLLMGLVMGAVAWLVVQAVWGLVVRSRGAGS